jgi:hypothetical protein
MLLQTLVPTYYNMILYRATFTIHLFTLTLSHFLGSLRDLKSLCLDYKE